MVTSVVVPDMMGTSGAHVKENLQRLERLTIRRRRYTMPAMAKAAKKEAGRKVVCASLPVADYLRLLAFGARESARSGLVPANGTLAVMLIRKGLDAVEAEAQAQPQQRRKAG